MRIPSVRGCSLTGWLAPAADSAATVVIVHGWGSNAAQMLPLALPQLVVWLVRFLREASAAGRWRVRERPVWFELTSCAPGFTVWGRAA